MGMALDTPSGLNRPSHSPWVLVGHPHLRFPWFPSPPPSKGAEKKLPMAFSLVGVVSERVWTCAHVRWFHGDPWARVGRNCA